MAPFVKLLLESVAPVIVDVVRRGLNRLSRRTSRRETIGLDGEPTQVRVGRRKPK